MANLDSDEVNFEDGAFESKRLLNLRGVKVKKSSNEFAVRLKNPSPDETVKLTVQRNFREIEQRKTPSPVSFNFIGSIISI